MPNRVRTPERAPGPGAPRPSVGLVPRLGVVLAAGRSERLRSVTGGGSKALVRLGGVTLVERAVLGLLRAGVQEVVVVVGYQAGPVAAVATRVAPGRVRAVFAEGWEAGNGASLAAAERALGPTDELFVVVTADHVFGEGVLGPLVRAGEPAVLVDAAPGRAVWQEGTRVRVRRGAAVAFGKTLRERPVDCGAFLLPRGVFACQREAAGEGDASLAGALTRLARTRPLRAVLLPPGGWWQDVDTPEDLQVARRRLRRSLGKEEDGPVSRYLNRPVSTRLSMVLAAVGLSPHLLSALSACVGMAGAWLLAQGSAVAGALVVHAASVLDGCDGEVARLRLRASPRGALVDGLLDRLVDAAVALGLGLWALDAGAEPPQALAATAAAVAGSVLSMASKDRITALGLRRASEGRLGWLLGGRDGRLALVGVLGGLGRPLAALVAVGATALAASGVRVVWAAGGLARKAPGEGEGARGAAPAGEPRYSR